MAQNIAMTPANLPLRDIHLPDPIGWWPLAPGWWALCGVLIVLLVVLWGVRRFQQRRRLRQLALKKLEELSGLPDTELLSALSRLLRQAAITHFPRQDCAGLSGQEWLDFLNQPFDDQPFSSGVGCCLSDAPYQRKAQIDASALVELCRRWLKKLPPQSLNIRRKL